MVADDDADDSDDHHIDIYNINHDIIDTSHASSP